MALRIFGGGFAQQLGGRRIHLQQMPLAVGHNDRLKDRLQHGVGELVLHLAASGFGVAQLAQPHRHPVQLAGDYAKAVAAAPRDAML